MESRVRRSRSRSQSSKSLRNAILLTLGLILLLAVVAGFIWMISNPQLIPSE
jgi:flagellar basal body-associated protein FliL